MIAGTRDMHVMQQNKPKNPEKLKSDSDDWAKMYPDVPIVKIDRRGNLSTTK